MDFKAKPLLQVTSPGGTAKPSDDVYPGEVTSDSVQVDYGMTTSKDPGQAIPELARIGTVMPAGR